MVNLTWLQTYVTLVETGHFTQTANKLAMTQPGVSQHVRKLEQHYKQPLLNRIGKGFELTQAGHRVYQQAQRTLGELAGLEQQLSTDDPFNGPVRIASPGSLGLELYPLLLNLQSKHPKLSIEYSFAPNTGVERDLVARKLDLGLVTRLGERPDLAYQPFGEEALCLVTPATVPEPTWDSLMTLGYIDHPDGPHQANLLLGANYPEYQQLSQFIKRGFCNHISLILEPVAQGLGFAVLPKFAVSSFAKQEAIRVHGLPNPIAEPIYLAQRRHQALPTRLQSIISEIASALGQIEASSN
ncbi:LysR family transcriptional regulator [Ferrimonas aestuarii]|uniref:LysR family transcriptional regulator n=1 Tax=Ferrimonas aestuarii TaxID=2569539 RepID=A0A4U1BLQ8_9GAMM|nr:LysR family transcriptional regulator [Ferrimonas aestuarii]TKB54228.1 LysR family transcriptional regulator [Ferrimonas aestuarii]